MSSLSKLSRKAAKRNAARSTDTPSRNTSSIFAAPTPRRSATPRSLRSLFHRRRERTAEPAILVESHPAVELTPVAPETSKLATTFVNTLNTSRVSDFFAWFLHFDLVELPESPAIWYSHIDTMEMRGWLSLGIYLTETTEYGMDIVVLDSICDRLSLQRRTVHDCLIQLSNPRKMAWTQLSTAVTESKAICKIEVERLEYVQERLYGLYLVAQRIKPTPASLSEEWRVGVEKRLRGYLTDVVAKRIEHHRLGTPLMGHTTCAQVSKDIQEALRLNYLYETMQQERQVPLVRYGLFPNSPQTPMSPSFQGDNQGVPIVRGSYIATECQVERSFSIAKMRSENTYLRGENEQLRRHNEALVDANGKLVKKVAALGRDPVLFTRPNWNTTLDPTPEAAGSPNRSQSLLLQVPRPRLRPRSLSDGAAEEYAVAQGHRLDLGTMATTVSSPRPVEKTSAGYFSKPKQVCAYPTPDSMISPGPEQRLSTPYDDVFAAFNEKPLPPLPLLHPNTGEPLTPLDTPCPTFRASRAANGLDTQMPCTPTPAGGQLKRGSLRIASVPPVTPVPRNPTHKAIPASEIKNTTPGSSRTHSTRTPSAPPTPVSRSNSNARSEALHKTTRSIPPLPAIPGPHNSLAELQARFLNQEAVQRPITPYSEPPSPLGMTKSRVRSIVRRLEGSVVDGETGGGRGQGQSCDEVGDSLEKERAQSLGSLDILLRRKGGDAEEEIQDVSRNF